MNKKFDLTVYIPTYNSAQTLHETLNSIINQTLQPNEIIVSDNISNDKTIEIATEYNTKGIKIITNINNNFNDVTNTEKGISNFNFILKHCKTKYLAIYHSDDIYYPTILEEQYNLIKNHDDAVAIFTKGKILHSNIFFKDIINKYYAYLFYYTKYNYQSLLKQNILKGNPFDFPTMFLNISKIRNIQLNNKYEQATDLDYIFKLTTKGTILRINKALYLRRISETQDSAIGKERYKYTIKPSFDLINDLLNTSNLTNFYYKIYNTSLFSEKIRCYLNKLKNNQNIDYLRINFQEINLFYIFLYRKKYFIIISLYIFVHYLFLPKYRKKYHLKVRNYFKFLYNV